MTFLYQKTSLKLSTTYLATVLGNNKHAVNSAKSPKNTVSSTLILNGGATLVTNSGPV